MTLKLQEISHVPYRGIRINRSLTVSGVGSFGINIHIGNDFIKVKYGKSVFIQWRSLASCLRTCTDYALPSHVYRRRRPRGCLRKPCEVF